MPAVSAENSGQMNAPEGWRLRVGGTAVYGPVSLYVLKEWAALGRIAPGNEVSADEKGWIPAEDLADLQMEWFAHLRTGDDYGPFNILAAPHMVKRGVIDQDSILENRKTGTKVPARSLIKAGSDILLVDSPQPAMQRQTGAVSKEVPVGSGERGSWYLKVHDSLVYGPVRLERLKEWAQVGRIGPGNHVSEDRRTWMPAESLPELKMDWIARSPEGVEYGPFNLLAIHHLVRAGVVNPDSILRNRHTSKRVSIHAIGNTEEWVREAAQDARHDQPLVERRAAPASQTPDPKQLLNRVADLEHRAASLTATLDEVYRTMEQKQRTYNELLCAAEGQKAELLSRIESLTWEAKESAASQESLRHLLEKEAAQRVKDTEAAAARETDLAERIVKLEHEHDLAVTLERECGRLRGELDAARQAVASESRQRADAQTARERVEVALRHQVEELQRDGVAAHSELEAARIKCRELLAQLNTFERQSTAAKADIEAAKHLLMEEKAAHESDLTRAKEERDELVCRLTKSASELDSAAGTLTNLRREVKEKTDALQVRTAGSGKQEAELAARAAALERECVRLRGELDAARLTVADEHSLRVEAEASRERVEAVVQDQVSQLKRSEEASRKAIEKAEQKRQRLLSQLSAMEKQAKAAKIRNDVLEQQMAAEKSAQKDDRTRAEKKEGELANRITSLERELDSADGTATKLRRELQGKTGELQELKEACGRQEAELAAQAAALQRECVKLRSERDVALQAAAGENGLRMEAQSRHAQTESALRNKIGQLEHALTAAQQALQTVRSKAAQQAQAGAAELAESRRQVLEQQQLSHAQQQAYEAKLQKLQAQLGALEEESVTAAASAKAAVRVTSEESSALKTALHCAEKEKGDLTGQITRLERELDLASGMTIGLRHDLEEKAGEVMALKDLCGKQASALAAKATELERARSELETAIQAVAHEKRLWEEASVNRVAAALRDRIGSLKKPGATAGDRAAGDSSVAWHLKLDDGSIFGPVTLSELCNWAAQCRIGADHQVSTDKKHWMPAQDVPALQMDWTVCLVDGSSYGPLNLEAIQSLVEQGVALPEAAVSNRKTGERSRLGDLLLRIARR